MRQADNINLASVHLYKKSYDVMDSDEKPATRYNQCPFHHFISKYCSSPNLMYILIILWFDLILWYKLIYYSS